MDDYNDGPEWDESYDFIIPKKHGDSIEWPAGNFLEMKCKTEDNGKTASNPYEYYSHMEIDSPVKTFSGEGSFSGRREALNTAVFEKFISEWQREEMLERYKDAYCE